MRRGTGWHSGYGWSVLVKGCKSHVKQVCKVVGVEKLGGLFHQGHCFDSIVDIVPSVTPHEQGKVCLFHPLGMGWMCPDKGKGFRSICSSGDVVIKIIQAGVDLWVEWSGKDPWCDSSIDTRAGEAVAVRVVGGKGIGCRHFLLVNSEQWLVWCFFL